MYKPLKRIPVWFEITKIEERASVQMGADVLSAAKEFSDDANIPLGVFVTNCVHEYLRRYNYDTYMYDKYLKKGQPEIVSEDELNEPNR
jgi:hypothetical protein